MIYLNRTDEPQVIRINAAKSDGSTSGKMYKDLVTADEAKNIAQATVDEALKNIDFETKTINGEEIKGVGNIDTLENYCYIDPEKWTLSNISQDAKCGNAFYFEMLPYNDIKTVGHPDYFGGYRYLVIYDGNYDNKKMYIAEAKEIPFLDSTDRFGSLTGRTELRQITDTTLGDNEIVYYLYYSCDPLNFQMQIMRKYDQIEYDPYNEQKVKGAYGLNNLDYNDFPLILKYIGNIYRRYGGLGIDDEFIDYHPVFYLTYDFYQYRFDGITIQANNVHIRYPWDDTVDIQPPMTTDKIEITTSTTAYNLNSSSINDAGNTYSPIYITNGEAKMCAHPSAGKYYSFVPYVNVNGRTDLCLDIDFHYDKYDTKDYDCRLHCTADGRLQTKTTGETEYRNLCRTTLNVRNLFDITQDDYDALVAAGATDDYTIYLVDGKHLYWKGEEIGKDGGGSSTGGVTSLNGETGDINLKTINGQSIIGDGEITITGATGGVTSVNGQTGDVTLDIPTVPTNISAFANDANYATVAQVTEVTSNKVTSTSVANIWAGTESEYGALTDKSATTLYIVY